MGQHNRKTQQKNKKKSTTDKTAEQEAFVSHDMSILSHIGNRGMQQLLHSGQILAKLNISQPDDAHEKEADRVAQQVVQGRNTPVKTNNQRVFMASRKPGKGYGSMSDSVHRRILGLQGGKSFSKNERVFYENRMGADFSGVKIHTGPTADQMAKAINARAFTYNSNIVFAKGEYSPGTTQGKKLMAHELTHVLQHNNTSLISRKPYDQLYYEYMFQNYYEHEVIPGDTLSELARDFNTTIEAIVSLNPQVQERSQPDQINIGEILKIPTSQYVHTNDNFEEYTGLPASSNLIEGVTSGFYNLRETPSISGTVAGELDGRYVPVTVHGEVIADNVTWFKISFKNTTDAAGYIPGRDFAWITSDAITAIVSYEQFITQLRSFEAFHKSLSLIDRIIRLRQVSHARNTPFDTVIGTEEGTYYEDERTNVNDTYQILREAKAMRLPNGEIVDIFHFIVGLESLQLDRREEDRYYNIFSVGSSYSAATWAGDIGAGAADLYLKQSEEYEDYFKEQERSDPDFDIDSERLNFYYNSRAPEADLLADIDAWGAFESVNQCRSIEQILIRYYGLPDRTGNELADNRKRAIRSFLSHYGFTSPAGLINQADVFSRMNTLIYKFAYIWLWKRRKGWQLLREVFGGMSNRIERTWLNIICMRMTIIFLNWLERLARRYGVDDLDGE